MTCSRGSTQLGRGRSTLAVLLNPLHFLHAFYSTLLPADCARHPPLESAFPRIPSAEVQDVHDSETLREYALTRRAQHNISRAIAYIWIWTRELETIEERAWDKWSFHRTPSQYLSHPAVADYIPDSLSPNTTRLTAHRYPRPSISSLTTTTKRQPTLATCLGPGNGVSEVPLNRTQSAMSCCCGYTPLHKVSQLTKLAEWC